MTGPVPNQISVWTETEVARSFAGRRIEEDGFSSCLKSTRAGDRALLHQSGPDGGVVGIIDFISPAFPHPDLRYAAWSVASLLDRPLARADLIADPVLGPIFQHLQGRRGLPADAAAHVLALLKKANGKLPNVPDESERPADGANFRWVPAGPTVTWGDERSMQVAVATDEDTWRELGFETAPEMERRLPDTHDRIDLYGKGLIGECKKWGELRALEQVDRYLAQLRVSESEVEWAAAIVVGRGFSRELAEEVSQRSDVKLVVCLRDDDDLPVLQDIAGPDDVIDWNPTRISGLEVLVARLEQSLIDLAHAAGMSQDEVSAVEQGDIPAVPEDVDPEVWWNGLSKTARARHALADGLNAVDLIALLLGDPVDGEDDDAIGAD